MATATQIATRALRRLRVIAADQTIAAADLASATTAIDDMMAEFSSGSLSNVPTTITAFDDRFVAGLSAMLAVRLAGEYGKEPDAVLVRDAERGENAINGAFFVVPAQRFPAGIVYTGQDTTADILFGTIYDDYKDWEASTAYALRDHVVNGSLIYECTTAGTSGSTGPTGTGTIITDGTCVWAFLRATE